MCEYFYTVFTPTYNRAYILPQLYNSLKTQTFKDFEWLVFDDGSDDGTEGLVLQFIQDGVLDIVYVKTDNRGKQSAINAAAKMARGKWFFIVDSDDYLITEALEISKKYIEQIEDNRSFAGVVGLRGENQDSVIEKNKFRANCLNLIKSHEYIDCTPLEYRYKYKIKGDRAEIIRTSLLREFPFPEIDGETFIPESYLWLKLSENQFRFRWFNKIIYITKYLEDGLTRNGKMIAKNSPNLKMVADNYSLKFKQIPVRERFMNCINYYRYGKYSNHKVIQLYCQSNDKIMSITAVIVAILFPIR